MSSNRMSSKETPCNYHHSFIAPVLLRVSQRPGKFFPLTPVFTRLFNHSHEKRKDNLEARAILLIFPLEISEVVVLSIHQNSKKW